MDKLYEIYKQSKGVNTDTRTTQVGEIYFALKGPSFNGNTYAKNALEAGACHVVIDEDDLTIKASLKTVVKNVLTTLQTLAHHHRKKLNKTTFIGITGSNGKTTHKELIKACLSTQYTTSATLGNLNNHIGVPLTILAIEPTTQFAIIEMGANHMKEIAFLSRIAKPEFGLITNVGKAHIEGFGSLDNIYKGKTELYENISLNKGKIFADYSNTKLIDYLPKDTSIIWYGNGANSSVKGEVKNSFPTLTMNLEIETQIFEVQSQLYGTYNLQNILAATCVANYFKITPENIKKAIENYKPENQRSEIKKTTRNTLIIDAYNANYSSMKLALEDFKNYPSKDKIAILGAMKEQGSESKNVHKEIMDLCKELEIEAYYLGKEYQEVSTSNKHVFDTKKTLNEALNLELLNGKTILLKGSRSAKLEELIPYL